jgi:hypothetical protein
LVAETLAKLVVHVQRLGQIVLGGQRFHEAAVTALPQRSQPGEPPTGSNRPRQLGAPKTELGGGVALERPDLEKAELVPDVVDPRCVLAREKSSLGDEQSQQDGTPGPSPVLLSDRRLGPVNGDGGRFEVDPRIR